MSARLHPSSSWGNMSADSKKTVDSLVKCFECDKVLPDPGPCPFGGSAGDVVPDCGPIRSRGAVK